MVAARLGEVAHKELQSHAKAEVVRQRPATGTYSNEQFLAQAAASCPVLYAFMTAASASGKADSAHLRQKRELSVAASLAALLKACNQNFVWEHGRAVAWTLFNLVNSSGAVQLMAGLGVGSPREAEQYKLYPAVAAAVAAHPFVIMSQADLMLAVDNVQRQKKTQSDVSQSTRFLIPVSAAVLVLKLPRAAGQLSSAQSKASAGPKWWSTHAA